MLATVLLLPSLLPPGAAPPARAVELKGPRVQYRANEASATRSPWIDCNGWRILRAPDQRFIYKVNGQAAALAAAEAFTYGAGALISTDEPGKLAFGRMLQFLESVPPLKLTPAADFGVIDDGTEVTGELLNLLTRMNLLYRIEKTPDRNFAVNVRLGTAAYPTDEARNPSFVAHKIRSQIGDDNRSLRIYGSEVVVGRLLKDARQGRVFLVNYADRPVLGLRVRVRGTYGKADVRAYGVTGEQPADFTHDEAATEFSLPELRTFAVIDLSRN